MADETGGTTREIARLQRLQQVNARSAMLHAMRASALELDVQRRAQQVDIIRSSTSWRLTAPLRGMVRLVTQGPGATIRASGDAARLLARRGALGAASHTISGWRRATAAFAARRGGRGTVKANPYVLPASAPASAILSPRVLIIAELSLPQCAKYRVWQKQSHLNLLGFDCTVMDWGNVDACRSALQTHPLAIFYRVPGFKSVLALMEEAKRLQVTTYWEADDLIFDIDRYRENRNLDTLDPALKAEVLAGVPLFRRAMLACDRTIASTEGLAEAMQALGAGPTLVIENALDGETIDVAAQVRQRARPARETVVIAYGSGSKAHDADFAVAAPAIAAVLRGHPHVRLRIIGDLQLPAALDGLAEQIERWPATGYAAYLGVLGEADISIAPLEETAFNDAKSNIKFLEAAMLGVPSVCSPRAAFRTAIEDGVTGFLAGAEAAWLEALTRLVQDPALRARIGQAALDAVSTRYAPARIAKTEGSALVAGLDTRTRPALRVLAVNIFYAPVSFGGATIVAEEMAERLHARADTEVIVFTSRKGSSQYLLTRYAHRGLPVIAVALPAPNVISEFDNPEMAVVFADVLAAVQPDVVHFHSVQRLGATLLRTCQAAGIPYAVTLHDAWWLCARQFMVRGDDSYCFQTRIDISVCDACLPGARHLNDRLDILLQGLEGAALLLSPSEAHRRLYLANGLAPERLLVNQNGIRLPSRPRRRVGGGALRFGYVGGISGLKGFHLVRAAFEATSEKEYTLVIVDNTLKLGWSSMDVGEWNVAGRIEIAPAFEQDGLDAFFDGIDVLLFPSQWKESFGLIVCEALARDVWVVVTEGGGAAEFVVDGENGTMIPLVNDPRPLQAAIEGLLAAPERIIAHENPHKGRIVGYAHQADELHEMLRSIVSKEA